jgi:hypothetical protein
LRGFVRNEGKFPQINVHFAFCWFEVLEGEISPLLWQNPRLRHTKDIESEIPPQSCQKPRPLRRG